MRVHLTGPTGDLAVPLGTHVLGRGQDCTLRIDDGRLSRHHARLHHLGASVTIEDLGSTNGVLSNGESISGTHTLESGQVIICGPCVFKILFDPTQKASKSELIPQTDRQPNPTDTEAMDPLELPGTDKVPTPAKKRQINPLIAAAVSASGTDLAAIGNKLPSDVSSAFLQPSEDSKSGTGALATKMAGKKLPPATANPKIGESIRPRGDQTSALVPSDFNSNSSSALQPDFPLNDRLGPAAAYKRAIGGLFDIVTVLLLITLLGLPVLVGGYVWALAQAGVTIEQGLPRLTSIPPTVTPTHDIIVSLSRPGGIERAGYLIETLARAQDQQPFLTIFATSTIAVLAAVVSILVYLIGATVVRGSPFWQRRMGLVIVEVNTGYHLTWMRAIVRWGLFALLWPLAPISLAADKRGLHDILSGCAVRQKL